MGAYCCRLISKPGHQRGASERGVGGERSPRLNHSDGCRIDLRNRLVRRRLERWRLDDDWVLVITLCPSVYRSRQKEEEKTNKKNWGKGRRRWRWQKPLRQKWIGPPTRILHKHINKTSDSTWGRIYRRQRCCALPFFLSRVQTSRPKYHLNNA